MEAEIQRKKEHLNFATNFQKSRGFVRTNWKSKNFDPKADPCAESSSTDESEVERRALEEKYDELDDDFSASKKKTVKESPEPLNELVDISSCSDNPSSRPDVETQLETLIETQLDTHSTPRACGCGLVRFFEAAHVSSIHTGPHCATGETVARKVSYGEGRPPLEAISRE